MFFILCHVILFFSKHNNSRMFWCNLRINHTNLQNKTFEKLRRLWENHERIFKRHRKTLQMKDVSKSQDIYMEVNTQKYEEMYDYERKKMHWGTSSMIHAPKRGPWAPSVIKNTLVCLKCGKNTLGRPITQPKCEENGP